LYADAVRCNRLSSDASDAEVEKVVRDWLRQASDRDGGRRRREARGVLNTTASAVRNEPPFPADPMASSEESRDES